MAKDRIFKVNGNNKIFYLIDLEAIYALEIEKDDDRDYYYVVGFARDGRTIEVGKEQADDFIGAWFAYKR